MSNKKIETVAIFAAYSKNENIYTDITYYLEELKKHADFLIYVSDNDFLSEDSLYIINHFSDAVILKKHNKYDFGSYQLGFQYILENKNLFNDIERIFFCNDSVIFCRNSLKDFFEKSKNTNFYGLTCHGRGFLKQETSTGITYPWTKLPHIQSFLFALSKEIFNQPMLRTFFDNIKTEKKKEDIIVKYEIGLSFLISQILGYKLEHYYPICEDFDPCGYFLSNESSYKESRLFLKRKPVYPVILK
jgi:lipopolysaccharide biosynthesis protein